MLESWHQASDSNKSSSNSEGKRKYRAGCESFSYGLVDRGIVSWSWWWIVAKGSIGINHIVCWAANLASSLNKKSREEAALAVIWGVAAHTECVSACRAWTIDVCNWSIAGTSWNTRCEIKVVAVWTWSADESWSTGWTVGSTRSAGCSKGIISEITRCHTGRNLKEKSSRARSALRSWIEAS